MAKNSETNKNVYGAQNEMNESMESAATVEKTPAKTVVRTAVRTKLLIKILPMDLTADKR